MAGEYVKWHLIGVLGWGRIAIIPLGVRGLIFIPMRSNSCWIREFSDFLSELGCLFGGLFHQQGELTIRLQVKCTRFRLNFLVETGIFLCLHPHFKIKDEVFKEIIDILRLKLLTWRRIDISPAQVTTESNPRDPWSRNSFRIKL